MKLRVETSVSELFESRKRYWLGQGYRGAEVYRRLAVDAELPTEIDETDAAAILRVLPETMKLRRHKKKPPAYVRRPGGVTYMTATLCDMLAEGVVEAVAA